MSYALRPKVVDPFLSEGGMPYLGLLFFNNDLFSLPSVHPMNQGSGLSRSSPEIKRHHATIYKIYPVKLIADVN